ncbi:PQQ-dependent sugar dehydrogenase [Halobellus salinisoli]|uniref:PQQ-dependent sugar dehydrogenase n=1 Tax=Halobellus salinisoli TaxID=3108500 RepID=UPI00300A1715
MVELDEPVKSSEPDRLQAGGTASRRRVLAAFGGAGVALGMPGLFVQQSQTIELDGDTAAWIGRAPESIAGTENPTLELEAGQEYEITWENVDGQPHNIAIQDSEGENIEATETISEQGATQTLSFTASREMTTYICEVHPTTMVGDVSVGGGNGDQTTQEGDSTEEPPDAGFFEEGTEIGVETVAEGMTAPTDYAIPGDDSGRQFVADQTGEVWVVGDDGLLDEPFIDVSDRMVTLGEFDGSYANPESMYDERGLLGVDFHPEFSDNGRFFLHYSVPPNDETPDGWDHVEVVSEFQTSDDGQSADPESERVLLEFQKPQYNHNGGPMAFGPDGYLYVPMGDGGGANDDMYGHVEDWYDRNSGGNGQDVTENLLGDIVRIDVDSEGNDTPYGIPEDNPFVGTEGRDEIYAYGFRNPYGVSFDSEGNLFVADAGQNLFEEIDVVERGGNYGWNVKEGTHCFSTESSSDPDAITDCPTSEPDEAPYTGQEFIDPVAEFPRVYQDESVGIVAIGGHRYEASAIPDLEGKYVFGAWTTDPARDEPDGRILAATPPEDFGDGEMDDPPDELWEMEELVVSGGLGYFVRMFGQGADGEVYVLANQRGVPEGDTGVLLEIVPPEEENGDTETATEGDTATDTETETEGTDEATGTDGGNGTETETPGFGAITSAVAVLGSVGLMLWRRNNNEDD